MLLGFCPSYVLLLYFFFPLVLVLVLVLFLFIFLFIFLLRFSPAFPFPCCIFSIFRGGAGGAQQPCLPVPLVLSLHYAVPAMK